MSDAVLSPSPVRTITTKDIRDALRDRFILIVTAFLGLAATVALVTGAIALRGDVATYEAAKATLLAKPRSWTPFGVRWMLAFGGSPSMRLVPRTGSVRLTKCVISWGSMNVCSSLGATKSMREISRCSFWVAAIGEFLGEFFGASMRHSN